MFRISSTENAVTSITINGQTYNFKDTKSRQLIEAVQTLLGDGVDGSVVASDTEPDGEGVKIWINTNELVAAEGEEYYNKVQTDALLNGIRAQIGNSSSISIDDSNIGETKTWSSQKISQELQQIGDLSVLGKKIINKEISNILLIGDSITDGAGGSNYNGNNGSGENNTDGYCWANILKKYLKDTYDVNVTNKGVYGSAITQQYNIAQSNVTNAYDLVIWLTGTNNRLSTVTFNEYKTTLPTMIDFITGKTDLLVISGIPSTQANENSMRYTMKEIDEYVMTKCIEKGTKYISGYKEFIEFCELRNINLADCFADHTHPNDLGYWVIFMILMRALRIPLSAYKSFKSSDYSIIGSGGSTSIACTNLTLNTNNLTFTTEESQTLVATKTPSNSTDIVNWSVEPTGIVSINNGIVTPLSNGNATITVTCGSQSATCSVEVNIANQTDILLYGNANILGGEFNSWTDGIIPVMLVGGYSAENNTMAFSSKIVTRIKFNPTVKGTITLGVVDVNTVGSSNFEMKNQTQFTMNSDGWITDLNYEIGANQTLAIGVVDDTARLRYYLNATNDLDKIFTKANWIHKNANPATQAAGIGLSADIYVAN